MSIRKCFPGWSLNACYGSLLSARPWHEAADLGRAIGIAIGPNDRRTKSVGLGYQRRIRDHDPLPVEPDTITSVLAVPIDVFDFDAVRKRTAEALFAGELVKPRFELRIGVATVIARRYAGSGYKHAQRHCNHSGKSVHNWPPDD